MTSNWQETFGGQVVKPAQVQFEEITLTGDVQLYWPTESLPGVSYVAAQINVSAAAGGHSLIMPSALNGATGVACNIINVGAQSVTLKDSTGGTILVIATGLSWIITLTDNTTAAGTWQTQQLGATTSSADASALAGAGLQAAAGKLRSYIPTTLLNANTLLDQTYRCNAVVWDKTTGGGTGTLQLDTIANLVAGWWCLVVNEGTGALTISPTGGATINGEASLVIPANHASGGQYYSAMIVCAAGGFNVFNMVPNPTPIVGGGTGADTAGQALINLGGSGIGIDIFEAPTAAAILALLGIGAGAFNEVTVGGDQILTPDQANYAYVCTAALALNLPDSTDVTNQFMIAAYAFGGAVTIQPVGTDKVNNAALGVPFVIPEGSSAVIISDGAGHWWPLFFAPTFDSIGNTQGDILYRGASEWQALAPSTDGYLLRTKGASANPEWDSISTILDTRSSTQGAILYRGAATWDALAPGLSGQVLTCGGPSANPSWSYAGGSLIQVDTYAIAGSYTWTRPSGCNYIIGSATAGGGGSSGAAVNAQIGMGAPGGAGATVQGAQASPSSSYSIIIGAAGTAGASSPTAGGNGGSSSMGFLGYTALGGAGGNTVASASTRSRLIASGGTGGGISGSGTPAPLFTANGGAGTGGCGYTDSGVGFIMAGTGGNSFYGGGGAAGALSQGAGASASGTPGGAPGAGAGAPAIDNGGAASVAGSAGGAGYGIIYSYR